MSRKLVFRIAARREFDEATQWYEEQRSGLGATFVAQVQLTFDRVVASPEQFAVVHRDIREALVHRFPFVIYFRDEVEQIIVLAVMHSSRNPAVWRDRI